MNQANRERVEEIRTKRGKSNSVSGDEFRFLLSIIDRRGEVVEAVKEFIRVQHSGPHEPGKLLGAYEDMQKVLRESEGAWE
ncbi:hypothetical protein KAR91_31805 [Candidatus Pacearchaeota archaeon]|nr:hypothetical protein [Candidatus Pacearchaeota archaeon]